MVEDFESELGGAVAVSGHGGLPRSGCLRDLIPSPRSEFQLSGIPTKLCFNYSDNIYLTMDKQSVSLSQM